MSAKIFATVVLALAPAVAVAAWQTVATEPGRRVEIDRASIVPGAGAIVNAKGRIVLDKSIVDTKTTESYRIIEIESRYDCAERTHATLKRAYASVGFLDKLSIVGGLGASARAGRYDRLHDLFLTFDRPGLGDCREQQLCGP